MHLAATAEFHLARLTNWLSTALLTCFANQLVIEQGQQRSERLYERGYFGDDGLGLVGTIGPMLHGWFTSPTTMTRAELKTPRLRVQSIVDAKMGGHFYLDDLIAIYSDPDVAKALFLPRGMQSAESICALVEEEGENWQDENRGLFLVFVGQSDRVVGFVKVQESPLGAPWRLEIVCAVRREDRGHGYAREAVRAVLDDEFQSGTSRMIARIAPSNTTSAALAQSLGFTPGTNRDDLWIGLEHVYYLRNPRSSQ